MKLLVDGEITCEDVFLQANLNTKLSVSITVYVISKRSLVPYMVLDTTHSLTHD